MIKRHERMHRTLHECVPFARKDEIVRHADRFCPRKNDVPVTTDERFEAALTADIEVHVNSAEVVEDAGNKREWPMSGEFDTDDTRRQAGLQVSNGIGPLDWILVSVKQRQERWVVLLDELS